LGARSHWEGFGDERIGALASYEELIPYFLLKRSTRPVVSTNFCLPVKKGWQLEHISI